LRECDGESAYFLVAELEQQIVGFGLIYLASTKGGSKKSHLPKMSDIYVVDHRRGEGVATSLVGALEALATQVGHSQIFLSIDPTESVAMTNLARKLSYEPVQTEPYAVSATFYDETGAAYPKHYTRLDYSKTLP
jgi:GNAT superfamily N-acetyltransferase